MANPFPFTAGQVLTAAQMNGIGEKTTYTPTFTGLTLGNGVLTAFHTRVNNIVNVFVQVALGTTSAVTGEVKISLPFARSDFRDFGIGNVTLYQIGTSVNMGAVIGDSTDKSLVLARQATVSGTTVLVNPLSATTPFTWTSFSILQFSYCYQAA